MMRGFVLLFCGLCAVAPAHAAEMIYSPPNAAQKTAFVRVAGDIKPGDAQQLDNTLRDAQGSGKQLAVTLSSNGGDVNESMAMGKVIRKYHADTYHEYCASNCVLAFIGGERRFLLTDNAGSALLVSRPDFVDDYMVTPSRELKQRLDSVRDYILAMTGGMAFYSHMMAIPFSTPHTLQPAEATSTKAVTQVLD